MNPVDIWNISHQNVDDKNVKICPKYQKLGFTPCAYLSNTNMCIIQCKTQN